MQRIEDYRPTELDTKGFGELDYPGWFVLPVVLTRDSNILERANYEATKRLVLANAHDMATELSFGHWACGWFNILIVRPGSPKHEIAEGVELGLEFHPIIDDDLYNKMRHDAIEEGWKDYGRDEWLTARKNSLHPPGNMDELLENIAWKYHAKPDLLELVSGDTQTHPEKQETVQAIAQDFLHGLGIKEGVSFADASDMTCGMLEFSEDRSFVFPPDEIVPQEQDLNALLKESVKRILPYGRDFTTNIFS